MFFKYKVTLREAVTRMCAVRSLSSNLSVRADCQVTLQQILYLVPREQVRRAELSIIPQVLESRRTLVRLNVHSSMTHTLRQQWQWT
jgi:hypothetical protein